MSKKKSAGKFAAKKKKSNKGLVTVLVLIVLLLAGLVAMLFLGLSDDGESIAEPESSTSSTTVPETSDEQKNVQTVTVEENSVNLGYGIYATDIGSYTGLYMEDGTDEILSGILMLVVKNDGAQDIQYAKITMPVGEETASFTLTTLPVGESVVLLESSRMLHQEDVDYSAILPKIENIAYFQEPVSTQEDKLKIGIVDGAINVTNISGADITGNIVVYYKNAAADLYYGGITYRVTVEGGLKADEIRQVMTNHASDTGSKIMFVTISQ